MGAFVSWVGCVTGFGVRGFVGTVDGVVGVSRVFVLVVADRPGMWEICGLLM